MRFKGVGLLSVGILVFSLMSYVSLALSGPCPSNDCYDDYTCADFYNECEGYPYPEFCYNVYTSGESCDLGKICIAGSCIDKIFGSCNMAQGQIPCQGGTPTCVMPNDQTRKDCIITSNINVVLDSSKAYYFKSLTINSGASLNFVRKSPITAFIVSSYVPGGSYGNPGTPDDGGGNGGRGGKGADLGKSSESGVQGSHGGGGSGGISGMYVHINARSITINGVLSSNGANGNSGGDASGEDCASRVIGGCTDWKGRGGGGGGGGGSGGYISIISETGIFGNGRIEAMGGIGGMGGKMTDEDGDKCRLSEDWGGVGGGGGGGAGGLVSISSPTVQPFKSCYGGEGGKSGCHPPWDSQYDFSYYGKPGSSGASGNCDLTFSMKEICDNDFDDDQDGDKDWADSECQYCGNRIPEIGEQCDDGNNLYNDGCYQCKFTCDVITTPLYKNTPYRILYDNNNCIVSTCNGVFPVPVITTETPPQLCDSGTPLKDRDCWCDGTCYSNQEANCSTPNNYYCSGSCSHPYTWVPCSGGGPVKEEVNSPGDVNYDVVRALINNDDDSLLGTNRNNIHDFFNPIALFDVVKDYCTCSPTKRCIDGGVTMIDDRCSSSGYCLCTPYCMEKKYYDSCSNGNTPICSGTCIGTSTKGVYLEKTYYATGGTYYPCGVADGVCPSDFSDSNQCGVNGVCQGITDPDCGPILPVSVCGNNILENPPEQCDLGVANTDTSCVAAPGMTCSYCNTTCQNVTVAGPGLVGITSIIISPIQGQGCSGQTCGSNANVSVTINFNGATIDLGTQADVNVRSNKGYDECLVPYLDYTTSSSFTNSLNYKGKLTRETITSLSCNNFIVDQTYDSKFTDNNGVVESSVFNGLFTGIKLSDCGDGELDNLPAGFGFSAYIEACDPAINSQALCTLLNSDMYSSGIATCNLNTCQWNVSSCGVAKCGDGIPQSPNAYGFDEDCDDKNSNNNDACKNDCTDNVCRDGFVYTGVEECDDGDWESYDGCSWNCKIDCWINSVVVAPNVGCRVSPNGFLCSQGNNVAVVVMTNPQCRSNATIQTDYNGSGCIIQRSGVDMLGMGYYGNVGSPAVVYFYNFTSVPYSCQGKTLRYVTSAIYDKKNFSDVRSQVFRGATTNITLDGCWPGIFKPYNLSFFDFVNQSRFNVTNLSNGCFVATCDAFRRMNTSTFSSGDGGVRVWNYSSGAFNSFSCNDEVDDLVCPNDFSVSGLCGNVSGICAVNGLIDSDCMPHTYMRCGNTSVPRDSTLTNFTSSCFVPVPVPNKYCPVDGSCVYADPDGSNKACYLFNESRNNSDSDPHLIQCVQNSTWCPYEYVFNGTECIYNNTECIGGNTVVGDGSVSYPYKLKSVAGIPYSLNLTVPRCDNVHNVSENLSHYTRVNISAFKSVHNTIWWDYLENNACFRFDNVTQRRNMYCAIRHGWPKVVYDFIPVGEFRYAIGPGGKIFKVNVVD